MTDDGQRPGLRTRIGEIPGRELVDELVRRLGLAETCRRIGVSISTEHELRHLADELDRLA
jgi:hypothetical protein